MVLAPFVAYFLLNFLNRDFLTTIQLFSYLGVILILIHGSKKKPIKFPKYLLFYLLFVLYIFFSTFYLLDRDFKIKYLITNRELGAFNLMLIVENTTISKKYFNLSIDLSKKILIIAILMIIIQQGINPNLFVHPEVAYMATLEPATESRLHSIYSWINMYSNGFAFVPVFLIVVELLDKQKKKILIWIVFGLIYAILTKTRWAMVNALMVFAFLFINHKDKTKRFFKYIFIIPVIMVSTYVVLNAVGINAKGIVEDRILESGKKQQSASTRLLAFKVFNDFFWKEYLLGAGNVKFGMGSDVKSRNPYALRRALHGSSQIHVGYLSLFYIYGLAGGSIFMAFLFTMMTKLYRNSKKTTYWSPFIGILGFVVGNLTFVTFSMLEMGLILALLMNKYFVDENKKQQRLKLNIENV